MTRNQDIKNVVPCGIDFYGPCNSLSLSRCLVPVTFNFFAIIRLTILNRYERILMGSGKGEGTEWHFELSSRGDPYHRPQKREEYLKRRMNEQIYNPYGNSFKLRGLPNNRPSWTLHLKLSCASKQKKTRENRSKVLSFQQNIEQTEYKKKEGKQEIFHLNRPFTTPKSFLYNNGSFGLNSLVVVVGRHDDFIR